ncbi:MAG: hypothetical protein Q9180_003053 [Flavoplaca navasiana]
MRLAMGGTEPAQHPSLMKMEWQTRRVRSVNALGEDDTDADAEPVYVTRLGLQYQATMYRYGIVSFSADLILWQGIPSFDARIIHRLGVKNGVQQKFKCVRDIAKIPLSLQVHPRRLRCEIDGCGTSFDFRTPFTKHVSKQHQRFIPDGAFDTELASRQPPPRQRRTRKVPEGSILVDIAPTLNPDSEQEQYSVEAPDDPPTTENTSTLLGPLDSLFLEGNDNLERRPTIDEQAVIEWFKNRKASLPGDGLSNERIVRARYCEFKPEYKVQESIRYPGQQQGLLWLSAKGKQDFEQIFEKVVVR